MYKNYSTQLVLLLFNHDHMETGMGLPLQEEESQFGFFNYILRLPVLETSNRLIAEKHVVCFLNVTAALQMGGRHDEGQLTVSTSSELIKSPAQSIQGFALSNL